MELEHLGKALKARATYRLRELIKLLSEQSSSRDELQNETHAVDIQLATKLHIECVVF